MSTFLLRHWITKLQKLDDLKHKCGCVNCHTGENNVHHTCENNVHHAGENNGLHKGENNVHYIGENNVFSSCPSKNNWDWEERVVTRLLCTCFFL